MKRFLILACTLILGSRSFASSSEYNFEKQIAKDQQYGQPVKFTDNKYFRSSIRILANLKSPAVKGNHIPDIKDIHARALKDFQSRFSNASKVSWYSDRSGFATYFFQDDLGNRAFYDKKGRWQYSLIFHNEDKLPRDVRAAVKSVYYDLNIVVVEEVQTVDGMVYIVHLEDKSNIKIIKVNKEGEMEIMQELVKG